MKLIFLGEKETKNKPIKYVISYHSNVGDPGSIPGSRRSPGEGDGNPLQYPCLENSMDGGAWWATVHEIAESQT